MAFIVALVLNTLGSLSFWAFISWLLLDNAGLYPIRGTASDRLIGSMISLALIGAILAVSGRGLSRNLAIANGAIVALQWWLFAGLGI